MPPRTTVTLLLVLSTWQEHLHLLTHPTLFSRMKVCQHDVFPPLPPLLLAPG